jgi:hypothetical protein
MCTFANMQDSQTPNQGVIGFLSHSRRSPPALVARSGNVLWCRTVLAGSLTTSGMRNAPCLPRSEYGLSRSYTMATERAFRDVDLSDRPCTGIGCWRPKFRQDEKATETSSHAPTRPSCTPLNSAPGNSILALEGLFSGSECSRPRHGGIDAV